VLILFAPLRTFRCLYVLLLASALSANLWAQSLVGEVIAIADGDTLTVLDVDRVQHKIRLAGIDAPERRQPFGQRARQMLAHLVFRKQVEIITEKKDRYGRTVGKVIYQGRDVNLILVLEGMAWHYKQYTREQDASDKRFYALAEDEARARRMGLWRAPQPIPPWSWRSGVRASELE
jgi:endonuclease YncB( thermonuclease family)